jgi:hypothetical protein
MPFGAGCGSKKDIPSDRCLFSDGDFSGIGHDWVQAMTFRLAKVGFDIGPSVSHAYMRLVRKAKLVLRVSFLSVLENKRS